MITIILLLVTLLLEGARAEDFILPAGSSPVYRTVGDNVTLTVRVSYYTTAVWTLGHTGLVITDSSKYTVDDEPPDTSLTILDAVEEDTQEYMLIINGTHTATIELIIQVPPSLSTVPNNVTGLVMTSSSLNCVARGNPAPDISWYKDDVFVSSSRFIIETHKGEQTTTSVLFFQLSLETAGQFHCNATNMIDSITSDVAIVTALYPPNVEVITPTSVTTNVTYSIALSCKAFGIPLPAVYWIRDSDGINITNGGDIPGNVIITNSRDSTNTLASVLNFTSVLKADESSYTCVAVNGISNVINTPTNGSIAITVQVPPVVTPLTPQLVNEQQGTTAVLSFNVTQADPPVAIDNIKWTFTSNTNSPVDITSSNGNRYSLSSDRLTLTIDHVTSLGDTGTYTLTATNEAGAISNAIQLIVQSPPKLYIIPEDQTLLINSTALFRCLAIGSPPIDHSWMFEGDLIAENGESFDDKYNVGTVGTEYGSLFISNVEFEDRGVYTCIYNNTFNSFHIPVTLTVQMPPIITDISVPSNATAGSTILMTCNATGYPLPSITWLFDGEILPKDRAMISTDADQEDDNGLYNVTSFLELSELMLSDKALYSCVAENDLVSIQNVSSEELELIVLHPPSISLVPSDATITINETDSITINCTAFSIPLSSTK